MDHTGIITRIKDKFPAFEAVSVAHNHPDEICVEVDPGVFRDICLLLHNILSCPVMMLFAQDLRDETGNFQIKCVFLDVKRACWIIISMDVRPQDPRFDSMAKSMHSASLFEREIWEMFGVKPEGNPDLRRLNLHDEAWPLGNYPLRKDFTGAKGGAYGEYKFGRVDGEGVFEVPVGPVHAGIIGPGHFRFSVAGEPIINLEARLGFTHRGIEKLFEGKNCPDAVDISECVSGDSAFAHSLSFTMAAEKLTGSQVSPRSVYLRAILLELERMYNHVHGIGGIAVDVGFSFPAAYASVIKETILQLNEKISGSRYLKRVNKVGSVLLELDETGKEMFINSLNLIKRDFDELMKILNSSVSFMDRVDTTGVLKRKTAVDLGIVGLAARASGIPSDLRKCFQGIYKEAKFKITVEQSGDVRARLEVRAAEFEESCRLIGFFLEKPILGKEAYSEPRLKAGTALGYVEGWRGPVLYWLKADKAGLIERCKIVDPSYHNWQGLAYAALGNIIPDFPLCNKSFDLSYSGNDL